MRLYFVCLLLSISAILKADMKPKPTKVFSMYLHTKNTEEIKKIYLLQCKDENCASYDTLYEMESQGITFSQKECKVTAYGFSQKNMLSIQLKNKTLRSNVFGGKAFNSRYDAIITDDGIEITETSSWWTYNGKFYVFFRALLFTLIVELIVAFFYFNAKKIKLKNLKFIIYINLLSLPIVWFVILELVQNLVLAFVIGEVFVLLFEWLLLMFFLRKKTNQNLDIDAIPSINYLSKTELFFCSFSMNISSLLIAGILSLLLLYS